VNLAKDALTFGTTRQAADRISELVQSQASEYDLAKSTALALIASVAYCEVDMYESTFDLLNSVIAHLVDTDSSDNKLLLAALYQQLAMRYYDYNAGDMYADLALKARSHLDDLNVESLSTFPLSRGVDWTSTTTLEDIIQALDTSAQLLLASTESPFSTGWQDVVRRRPGYLDLRGLRSAASAYESFVDDLFEIKLPSGTVTFGRVSSDNYLYSALLSEELLGRPSARSTRSDLGKIRFLQGAETNEEWLMTEAMNLLRQGRDHRRLRSVVAFIRNAGPLKALATCAKQIMTERAPASLALGELIVLRAAVDQLDPQTANSYFLRIAQIFSNPESFTLKDLTLKEEALLTAAELANVASTPTGFADMLLEIVKRAPQREFYEMAVARAIYVFDFSRMTVEERAGWTAWISEQGSGDPVVRTVNFKLDPEVSPYSDGTLDAVAYHVDRWLRSKHPIPDNVARDAATILANRLQEIRDDAHRGKFSMQTTIDAAAAAVVIAQHSGNSKLWTDLASFLSDSSIQRSDTESAFELLSEDPSLVPQVVRTELAAQVTPLLYRTQVLLESQTISPYPSALKCFISLQLMELPAVIVEVSALAGSAMDQARAAACSALSAYAVRVDRQSSWASVLALQLSKDRAATVRARAGRTLVALLEPPNELRSLMLTRVEALMGEDGLAVPVNLLRELAASRTALDPQLVSRIQQLASTNASAQIRVAATKVLTRQLR